MLSFQFDEDNFDLNEFSLHKYQQRHNYPRMGCNYRRNPMHSIAYYSLVLEVNEVHFSNNVIEIHVLNDNIDIEEEEPNVYNHKIYTMGSYLDWMWNGRWRERKSTWWKTSCCFVSLSIWKTRTRTKNILCKVLTITNGILERIPSVNSNRSIDYWFQSNERKQSPVSTTQLNRDSLKMKWIVYLTYLLSIVCDERWTWQVPDWCTRQIHS